MLRNLGGGSDRCYAPLLGGGKRGGGQKWSKKASRNL